MAGDSTGAINLVEALWLKQPEDQFRWNDEARVAIHDYNLRDIGI